MINKHKMWKYSCELGLSVDSDRNTLNVNRYWMLETSRRRKEQWCRAIMWWQRDLEKKIVDGLAQLSAPGHERSDNKIMLHKRVMSFGSKIEGDSRKKPFAPWECLRHETRLISWVNYKRLLTECAMCYEVRDANCRMLLLHAHRWIEAD